MTLDEVQKEIVRLNNIKRQLVEEALKSYDAKAKQYVGKCYKMERSGIVFKILREPIRVCDVDCHYRYYKNIFSALFLNYPTFPKADDTFENFEPFYCDDLYFNIDTMECPKGAIEITSEEFDAEFDRHVKYFKELISV